MTHKLCSSCKTEPATIRSYCHPCKAEQSRKSRKRAHFKLVMPVNQEWMKKYKESEQRILMRFTR